MLNELLYADLGNFSEDQEDEKYVNSVKPGVAYIEDVSAVTYNWCRSKLIPVGEYLTFSILTAGTIGWKCLGGSTPKILKYSVNGGAWTEITAATENFPTFNVSTGDIVRFSGDTADCGRVGFSNNAHMFVGTAGYDLSGNIMSLVDFSGAPRFPMLFESCNVVNASGLSLSDEVVGGSFMNMFSNCTSLVTAPQLPATDLGYACYKEMFSGCSNLTTAPFLPATTLAPQCYTSMFSGCASLNHIEAMFTTTPGDEYTKDWVNGVSSTGTFAKNSSASWNNTGTNGIPTNWNVAVYNNGQKPVAGLTATKYLTFTTTGNTTLSLKNYGGNSPVIYGSLDNGLSWFLWDHSDVIFSSGRNLLMCGSNDNGFNFSNLKYSTFTSTGSNFSISGDVMSLINRNSNVAAIPNKYCFYRAFMNCKQLVSAPALSATTPNDYCYCGMFYRCSNLTSTPALPALVMKPHCYQDMFGECTGITAAPVLSSTTLDAWCYKGMFFKCVGLSSIPALPAITMAPHCYAEMFRNCTGLTAKPTLASTSLDDGCYRSMFQGCTGLTSQNLPELSATTLTPYCYQMMFKACTSIVSANTLPAMSIPNGAYTAMFDECTSLTTITLPATRVAAAGYNHLLHKTAIVTPPSLPATDLGMWCYWGLFSSCKSLSSAPQLPATTVPVGAYLSMFYACSNMVITSANTLTLPATSFTVMCYHSMLQKCSKVASLECLGVGDNDESTLSFLVDVASDGTFYRNPDKNDWKHNTSTYKNGIPENWTVEPELPVSLSLTSESGDPEESEI